MANQSISLMKLREVIRLKNSGLSNLAIGQALALSRTTVVKYLAIIKSSDLSAEALEALPDEELNMLLHSGYRDEADERWAEMRELLPHYTQELARPHVTRFLLWEEYRKDHPNGYGKTQFFHYLRQHQLVQQGYQPREHKAGEKVFLDYAGDHLYLTDTDSGELIPVEVFVAVLGCSGYTYVEASHSQKTECFSTSVQNAFHYFGGVSGGVVPDNLKSAVKRANRYEPDLNERLVMLARHYGTVILPARVRKPKDKPKVENGVRIVYYRIYARLRDRVFHSLKELNKAIWEEELPRYNRIPYQGRDYSRQDLFEQVEREHLRPLPLERFLWKHQRELTVYPNCHVYIRQPGHHYSVPYRYIGRKVKVLYDSQHVEIFCQGQRVAFHNWSERPFAYTTVADHMPSHHRYVSRWNEAFFMERARHIGTVTEQLFAALFRTKEHPEQAYKSCQGILSLARKHGAPAVERACQVALDRRQYNYGFIDYELKRSGSKQAPAPPLAIPKHENERGAGYYKQAPANE